MGLLIRLLILPIRRPILAIVLGLIIISSVLIWGRNMEPTCGGKTMGRADICHTLTDTDGSSDETYDDVKADQSSAPYIWSTLGGVLVLGGAVSWPIRRRRAARAAAAAAAAAAADVHVG